MRPRPRHGACKSSAATRVNPANQKGGSRWGSTRGWSDGGREARDAACARAVLAPSAVRLRMGGRGQRLLRVAGEPAGGRGLGAGARGKGPAASGGPTQPSRRAAAQGLTGRTRLEATGDRLGSEPGLDLLDDPLGVVEVRVHVLHCRNRTELIVTPSPSSQPSRSTISCAPIPGRAFGSSITLCPSPTREVASPYLTSNGPPLYVGCDLMKSILAGIASGLVRKGIHPDA